MFTVSQTFSLSFLYIVHKIILNAWNAGTVPADWRDAIGIPLYKGINKLCVHYSGIALLSPTGKILM